MFIMFISSLMFLFSDSTTLALHDLQFEMISIYLTMRLTADYSPSVHPLSGTIHFSLLPLSQLCCDQLPFVNRTFERQMGKPSVYPGQCSSPSRANTPMASLDSPINQISMPLDCGRKQKHLEKYTDTGNRFKIQRDKLQFPIFFLNMYFFIEYIANKITSFMLAKKRNKNCS